MKQQVVNIKGDYHTTGFILGNCHRGIWQNYRKVLNNSKKDKFFYEKLKRYEKNLRIFPDLFEELIGYCKGSEINFEEFVFLNKQDIAIEKVSCTSLYLSEKFSETKEKVFMKIRDEKPFPQYIGKKHNNEKTPYFFSGSVGHSGISFFFKESGFVGINNTGSFLRKEEINTDGFNDCEIMKIIVENCDTPEEGIELIKRLQKEKLVGITGKNRGMIFLFGNREKVFLVECTSYSMNFKEVKDKIGFTNDFLIEDSENWIENIETQGSISSRKRKARIDEILKKERIDRNYLCKVSRDKENYPYSIARDTSIMPVRTISSFIACLNNLPVVWVCLGHPWVSPYFPFYINGGQILYSLVSGDVSVLLNTLFNKKGMDDEAYLKKIEDFENNLEKDFLIESGNNFVKQDFFNEINLEIQKRFVSFVTN